MSTDSKPKTNLWLKNKYVIVLVAFIIWVVFFDRSGLMNRIKKTRELRELQNQEQFYLNEIEKNRKMLEELQGDTDALERFAREQYYMKKEKEDIFIIKED